MLRFLCLLLLGLALPVQAVEIIVATGNPAASDSNPGTAARPLKTISAAAAKVQPGDHVIIHGGDYREMVMIVTSGTAEAPIVFESAPNETPVIKGSDLLADWQHEEGAIWKASLPSFPPATQDGKNPAYFNTFNVRQVFARDGVLLDAERLTQVNERKEMRAGTFFSDPAAAKVWVWLQDSGSPREHPPEVSLRGAWLFVYGNYITVRGLQMRHASTTAFADWPACDLVGEHITLEKCVLSWGDFAGLSVGGKSNRVTYCTVACNGNSGGGGTGEGHLVEDCRFLYNNVDRYDIGWHAGGAKFIPSFRHSIIRHNEFAHNLGPGLWLDDLCDDNVIDGNFAHDNEGAGIMVEASRGNLVMNNITTVNRNLLSGPYRAADGSIKLTLESEQRIAPSRLFRPYHAGDGRGIYISTSPATKVFNNTCYLNEAEGICVEGPQRGEMETKDTVVMNNISVFNHGSQLTIRAASGAGQTCGTSDYNLLFSVGAVFARTGWDGSSAYDLKQWQTASGQDQHSIDADPRFALAAMNDFGLLSGSPALAAGQTLPQVDHDFLGRARGKDNPTIGALEALARSYPRPIWDDAR